ncbi:MAG: serine endopeptidase [Alysiella sp.]|uniref:zinc ribbon domain-containing protein n=1 Tax=Alysiella sp. TaxID=1872483 RepID=UPI0026DC6D4A|nr:zinc ribbon domain-containing protein [Alysiella sp.]MDO4433444.1 serine endopeptidase [Alysiella sp.]
MKIQKSTPTLAETNRRTEKWFRRGLWLLAVVFASFLIGLGGKIVDDLPKVEQSHELSHYIADKAQYEQLNAQKSQLEKRLGEHENALEQAQLALEKQRNETQSQREKYIASLATRKISEDREQNEKVFERTAEYEQLLAKERDLEKQVEQVRQQKLDTEQAIEQISGSLNDLERAAEPLKAAADRATELKVFLYRLALTLPLLLAAGWLFKNKRQSRWFPFVWGFIFFALFAFFVELVPYLPSYGGYVRHLVGIAVTVLVGKYAIAAMYRYLERKQAEEAQPITERETLNYDLAQNRLAKQICPSCERPLDFTNENMDFCPHCSVQLFKKCGNCQTRSSAFNRYCYACGQKHE